jgi:hypothetical protein
MLSEDETKSDVQAAHGKEEKCGDKREFVNVVGENRCSNAKRAIRILSSVTVIVAKIHLQSLEDPKRAEAKLRTEDREEAVEEGHRPRDLG